MQLHLICFASASDLPLPPATFAQSYVGNVLQIQVLEATAAVSLRMDQVFLRMLRCSCMHFRLAGETNTGGAQHVEGCRPHRQTSACSDSTYLGTAKFGSRHAPVVFDCLLSRACSFRVHRNSMYQ